MALSLALPGYLARLVARLKLVSLKAKCLTGVLFCILMALLGTTDGTFPHVILRLLTFLGDMDSTYRGEGAGTGIVQTTLDVSVFIVLAVYSE
ncbi:hypothetical protein EDB92DRAFT_61812 [Lactarius akahatsu]|uniref:Uncharacterized protein n=1 Tax=Lactarius akahatsu TaxID=416441 RepID=A0AAD4LVE5_9AGAM|nr:hypothetical protein EDB92DRAFT_61812 [Lactarius akahatsu]